MSTRDAAIDRSIAVLAEALSEALDGWNACLDYKDEYAITDEDKAAIASLRELHARFTRKDPPKNQPSDLDEKFGWWPGSYGDNGPESV